MYEKNLRHQVMMSTIFTVGLIVLIAILLAIFLKAPKMGLSQQIQSVQPAQPTGIDFDRYSWVWITVQKEESLSQIVESLADSRHTIPLSPIIKAICTENNLKGSWYIVEGWKLKIPVVSYRQGNLRVAERLCENLLPEKYTR